MKCLAIVLAVATFALAAASPLFAAVLRMPQVWAVLGFCALMTIVALLMDRAADREWRDRLHRIEQIRSNR